MYFPVVCIYTFNSRPFSIPIELYKSIIRTRFISWAWKVISYKQITKKNCMKCYFLCIFVRPVFCMWCKNETAKIITPNFPICQMKRKWIKLWSEFFSVFCFAIFLPYKRQCCSIIGKEYIHAFLYWFYSNSSFSILHTTFLNLNASKGSIIDETGWWWQGNTMENISTSNIPNKHSHVF